MHITASVTFRRKDWKKAPERGLIHESWTFGKDEPTAFWVLAACMVRRLSEFWLAVDQDMTDEQFNAQLAKLAEYLAGCRIEAEPIPTAIEQGA